jgi:hypothetical protein
VRLVIDFAQQIFDPDAPKTGLDKPAQDFHFRRYVQSIANIMHEAAAVSADHVPSGKVSGFIIREAALRSDVRPATRRLELFGPVHLPPILPAIPTLYSVLRKAHTVLAYLLFLTFLAHLSAVLFHTLIIRDRSQS